MDYPPQNTVLTTPSSSGSSLLLYVSIQGLPTPTSTQVVVSLASSPQPSFSTIGQSEIIPNATNPEFADSVKLVYHFEKVQLLRFEVFAVGEGGQQPTKLTQFDTPLSKLILSSNGKLVTKFEEGSLHNTTLCIRYEEVHGSQIWEPYQPASEYSDETIHMLTYRCSASNLDRM